MSLPALATSVRMMSNEASIFSSAGDVTWPACCAETLAPTSKEAAARAARGMRVMVHSFGDGDRCRRFRLVDGVRHNLPPTTPLIDCTCGSGD